MIGFYGLFSDSDLRIRIAFFLENVGLHSGKKDKPHEYLMLLNKTPGVNNPPFLRSSRAFWRWGFYLTTCASRIQTCACHRMSHFYLSSEGLSNPPSYWIRFPGSTNIRIITLKMSGITQKRSR